MEEGDYVQNVVENDIEYNNEYADQPSSQLPSCSNPDEETKTDVLSYLEKDMSTQGHSSETVTSQLPSCSNPDEETKTDVLSYLEKDMTTQGHSSETVTSDSVISILCEHQSSTIASCLDCKVDICTQCLSTTHKHHRTIRQDILIHFKEELSALARCEEEISRQIVRFQKGEEDINAAAKDISRRILQKVSELTAQLERDETLLQMRLDSQKKEKLIEVENVKQNAQRYQQKITAMRTELNDILSKGSVEEICKILENHESIKSLLQEKDVYIRRPDPSLAIEFRDKETTDNILGKLEELTKERQSGAAPRSTRPKVQTLESYLRLLTDLYRQISDARNDGSKITTVFNKEEIISIHGSDFLENVQRELDLSDANTRWDEMQTIYTRMASLLYAITGPDSEMSSDQMESRLIEIRSCITKLWNAIQFHIHYRRSAEGLAPKGLQNLGNTCYFNSVMQCLFQTVRLSFELTLNLENVLKGFTLSEAYAELASKYSEFNERERALRALYYKFTEVTPRFSHGRQHDSHDLLIHFLDRFRVEESNVWKSQSVGQETQKMLTAVDRIFGGQFITVYTCLSCEEPYAIREPFLDISLPLCTLSADEKKTTEQSKNKSTLSFGLVKIAESKIKSPLDQTSEQQNSLGTSSAESQQRPITDARNDAENHSSSEVNHRPSLAADDNSKASCKREVIKKMLEPLTVASPAEAEAKRLLSLSTVFDLFNKSPNPNVSECLKYFTRAEEIENEYLCRKCQTPGSDQLRMTSATKRTLISSPPAVLVLHLKRFEQTPAGFIKRDEMIPYEELLELGPFCSCSALRIDPEEENVWYSLYAVVVHCGFFLFQGHYIAYVKQRDSSAQLEDHVMEKFLQKDGGEREKVPNDNDVATMEKRKRTKKRKKAERPNAITGQWYYISDESVRTCDAKVALDQKAFMLFYERIPGNDH